MSQIKAQRMESFDNLTQPGHFIFTSRVGCDVHTGILFVCPCGCGEFGGITLNVPEAEGLSGPKWDWDGNVDSPTIKPSIRKIGGCAWHGFLTAGVFIQC